MDSSIASPKASATVFILHRSHCLGCSLTPSMLAAIVRGHARRDAILGRICLSVWTSLSPILMDHTSAVPPHAGSWALKKNKTPPHRSFANESIVIWQNSCCAIMNGSCIGHCRRRLSARVRMLLTARRTARYRFHTVAWPCEVYTCRGQSCKISVVGDSEPVGPGLTENFQSGGTVSDHAAKAKSSFSASNAMHCG
jgi:hypothetical protein